MLFKSGRSRIGLTVALLALAAGGGWLWKNTDNLAASFVPPVSEAARRIDASEYTVIEMLPLRDLVRVTGNVVPRHKVEIASQVSGRADEVLRHPGDAVKAGDILLRIDSRDLQVQLDQQQASIDSNKVALEVTKRNLRRQAELKKKGVVASSAYEDAEAEVRKIEAAIRQGEAGRAAVQLNFDRSEIKAPIDGVVSARSVEPGQMVSSNQQVFAIVSEQDLLVEVQVPWRHASNLKLGMAAEFSRPEAPGEMIEAKIERINPQMDASNRSTMVYVDLGLAPGVRPGGFLAGKIVIREKSEGVILPLAAVNREKSTVEALRDGRLAEVKVEIGDEWQQGLEIVSGLSIGDIVLLKPLSGLKSGDGVEIDGGAS